MKDEFDERGLDLVGKTSFNERIQAGYKAMWMEKCALNLKSSDNPELGFYKDIAKKKRNKNGNEIIV